VDRLAVMMIRWLLHEGSGFHISRFHHPLILAAADFMSADFTILSSWLLRISYQQIPPSSHLGCCGFHISRFHRPLTILPAVGAGKLF